MIGRAKHHKLVFALIVLGFMMPGGEVFARDEKTSGMVEVTAKADKEKLHIGDRVTLDVAVRAARGYEISFPERPVETGDFIFVGSEPIKGWLGKRGGAGHKYIVTINKLGTQVLPPVSVKYRTRGEGSWSTSETEGVPLEVVSLLKGDETDILDIKGLARVRWSGWWKYLVAGLLLVTAGIIYSVYRRKMVPAASSVEERSAHEIAYEELSKLRALDLPGEGRINEYYVILSDIVRHYLERRFSVRAPEMTTEEFLDILKKSKVMENPHKELLKEFLSQCDMVKFAKYGPRPIEVIDSFNAAEKLVDQTKIVEEKPET